MKQFGAREGVGSDFIWQNSGKLIYHSVFVIF